MPRKDIDAGLVDELKIDKDCIVDKLWIRDYVELILSICKKFRVKALFIRMCLSKCKGAHYYIKIDPPIDSTLANRIQWLLGDDCERVDFNRARIRVGFKEWNKLFENSKTRLRTIYKTRSFAPHRNIED
jgi:hypothetical protein